MKAKYLYTYRDRDRHKKERIYFRRAPGEKKILMPYFPAGETPTPEFVEAHRAALARYTGAMAPAEASPPTAHHAMGTFGWLCVQYFAAGEFLQLEASTRSARRGILEHCMLEPVAPGAATLFAAVPIVQFNAKAVRVLRDRKVNLPEAANGRVKAIRQVFKWGLKSEGNVVLANPARDVEYLKGNKDGFHTWTIEEVQTFAQRHPLGTKAHLALALLLFVGVRRSDVVKLGRQMVRQGWISFTETKGAGVVAKHRQVPVVPPLAHVIDRTNVGNMTFLVTEFDRPFSAAGFGNWFRKRCDEAGLNHCSAHGLRKAGATIAAENGATEHQLMAMYGWESPKQAAIYTRRANRKKLAGTGMPLIELGDLAGIEDIPEAELEAVDRDEAGTDYPNQNAGLG